MGYGGGACEMNMSIALSKYADNIPGLEQYSIRAFAKALQIVPMTLAENAGLNTTQVIANLHAAHYNHQTKKAKNGDDGCGVCDTGIDIDYHDNITDNNNILTTKTEPTSIGNQNRNSDDQSLYGIKSMKEKDIVDLLITK